MPVNMYLLLKRFIFLVFKMCNATIIHAKQTKSELNIWCLDDGTVGILMLLYICLNITVRKCELISDYEDTVKIFNLFKSVAPDITLVSPRSATLLEASIYCED
jgi:hypothetical protein